jgi:hypothetical protein
LKPLRRMIFLPCRTIFGSAIPTSSCPPGGAL